MKRLLGTSGVLLLTAALVVGVVVALDDDREREPNLIAHSADVAAEWGTARVGLTTAAEFPEGSGEPSGSFGAEGVIDLARDAVQLSVDLSGDPHFEGSGDLRMEMVMVGAVVYVRMPEDPADPVSMLPTPWFSIDFAGLDDDLAGDVFDTDWFGSEDPTMMLDYLRGAGSDIEELGTETVRDVETTHYRVTVDLVAAMQDAPPSERAELGHAIADLQQLTGDTTVPMEVWIDADGLPRRMHFAFELARDDDGIPAGTRLSMTMELWDYGLDVDIQPPPAEQVTDLTSLVEAGGF